MRSGSKYDFVKIKVIVSDDHESSSHYFILSRFLISRTLTSTKILQKDAIKIALGLKKTLVANNQLVVTQRELEETLFRLIKEHGYGQDMIDRYRTLSRFHHDRKSLIILLAGTGCIGKSTIATKLCETLNLPCVLQTDVISCFSNIVTGNQNEVIDWTKSENDLIAQFQKSCDTHFRMIAQDIRKTVDEGKSLLVEGLHLDPRLFAPFVHSLLNLDSSNRPVVVSFLLTADLPTHQLLVESSGRSLDHMTGLRILQQYLESQAALCGMTCVPVSMNLGTDFLHDAVLDRMLALYN
eukprot:c4205_g1_i1.p1 GENE.c4205_g1_i1~~c4205_g1_i1.p1  ORF type:complete len:296 (+),score=56.22 c4205_g1_i1:151-1038(+)